MTWLLKETKASEKIQSFKEALHSGKLLQFAGAFSPFISMIVEKLGFDGVYISGAGVANDLAFPDIGLTTLTEVKERGAQIARVTQLPNLIDIDTGFGESMSVARTIREFEEAGLTAVHLEDQVNPKRCGHLDNKSLVSCQEMSQKITAAAKAKSNPDFIICARTDSRASEGLEASIERAKSYVDSGADMIFPEALKTQSEFEAFRKAIKVPLLANMTEFGKSELLTKEELQNLGYNLVIYPMTSFRLAMKAVEDGLREIKKDGHQKNILDRMQARSRLYEIIDYEKYNEFDQGVFNFKLRKDQ